jgi:opacity protein-like surface antigen
VSADVSYDLNRIVTLGAKYGARYGEIKERSGSAGWQTSTTQLGIIRADFNVISKWDALIEGRLMWIPDTDSTNLGALAAVYYDISENFKIGTGYNFGRFSDDLRDLTYDDHGVFFNAVGKF